MEQLVKFCPVLYDGAEIGEYLWYLWGAGLWLKSWLIACHGCPFVIGSILIASAQICSLIFMGQSKHDELFFYDQLNLAQTATNPWVELLHPLCLFLSQLIRPHLLPFIDFFLHHTCTFLPFFNKLLTDLEHFRLVITLQPKVLLKEKPLHRRKFFGYLLWP